MRHIMEHVHSAAHLASLQMAVFSEILPQSPGYAVPVDPSVDTSSPVAGRHVRSVSSSSVLADSSPTTVLLHVQQWRDASSVALGRRPVSLWDLVFGKPFVGRCHEVLTAAFNALNLEPELQKAFALIAQSVPPASAGICVVGERL